jgi:hypothetical protein
MNQLADLLVLYLTNPSTDFYLPKIIQQSGNPTLEPFDAANIDLGSFDLMKSTVSVRLQDLEITGMSNVQVVKQNGVPVISVNDNQVTFQANRPNTESPPVGVPVNLIFDAQLVVTAKGSPSPPVPVVVTITNTTIDGVFTATGDSGNPGTVAIRFLQLKISADATPANIQFDVSKLNSFIKPQLVSWLAAPATLNKIITEMNTQLNSTTVLNALNQSATKMAQSTLKSIYTT